MRDLIETLPPANVEIYALLDALQELFHNLDRATSEERRRWPQAQRTTTSRSNVAVRTGAALLRCLYTDSVPSHWGASAQAECMNTNGVQMHLGRILDANQRYPVSIVCSTIN